MDARFKVRSQVDHCVAAVSENLNVSHNEAGLSESTDIVSTHIVSTHIVSTHIAIESGSAIPGCKRNSDRCPLPLADSRSLLKPCPAEQQVCECQVLLSKAQSYLQRLLELNLKTTAHGNAKELLVNVIRARDTGAPEAPEIINGILQFLEYDIFSRDFCGGAGSPDAFKVYELIPDMLLPSEKIHDLLSRNYGPLSWNDFPFHIFIKLNEQMTCVHQEKLVEHIKKHASAFCLNKSDYQYQFFLNERLNTPGALHWSLSIECLSEHIENSAFIFHKPPVTESIMEIWLNALCFEEQNPAINYSLLFRCIERNIHESVRLTALFYDKVQRSPEGTKNNLIIEALRHQLSCCVEQLSNAGAKVVLDDQDRQALARNILEGTHRCISFDLLEKVFPGMPVMLFSDGTSALDLMLKNMDQNDSDHCQRFSEWLPANEKAGIITADQSLEKTLLLLNGREELFDSDIFLNLQLCHALVSSLYRGGRPSDSLKITSMPPDVAVLLNLKPQMTAEDYKILFQKLNAIGADTRTVTAILDLAPDSLPVRCFIAHLLHDPDYRDLREWLLLREINPLCCIKTGSAYPWGDLLHGFYRHCQLPFSSEICQSFEETIKKEQMKPIEKVTASQLVPTVATGGNKGLYNRSFWVECAGKDVIRLKFRKRTGDIDEPLETLRREPSILRFLREQQSLYNNSHGIHKQGLELKSHFPEPDQVYLLDDFEQWLMNSGLNEVEKERLRSAVAVEPDGSVYVYRFYTENETYHHYVHETFGFPQASINNSLQGLWKAAHDAGVLFHHGLHVVNALPAFHDIGAERHYMALTNFINRRENGGLGNWDGSATEYPNISNDGLRDYADIMSTEELSNEDASRYLRYDSSIPLPSEATALNGLAEIAMTLDLLLGRMLSDHLDYQDDTQAQFLISEIRKLYQVLFGRAFNMVDPADFELPEIDRVFEQSAREMAFWCSKNVEQNLAMCKANRTVPEILYPENVRWLEMSPKGEHAKECIKIWADISCLKLHSQSHSRAMAVESMYPLIQLQCLKTWLIIAGLSQMETTRK